MSTSGKKRTYLELSEEGEGSHKFYEVTVDNCDVTIRYGRIGTDGQSSTKSYGDATKAQKDAEKKIKAKKKKGYDEAVMGVRQKRAVTRRSVNSKTSTAPPAPVLWRFATGSDAFGVYVDHQACWVGNQEGRVVRLDAQGSTVEQQFQLPQGVKCLCMDDDFLYAGCDDGNVYDLSRNVPHVSYEIDESVNILWLDICDGVLAVSDDHGAVHMFNHENEGQWHHPASSGGGATSGWMVRCDDQAVYQGHSQGVTAYNIQTGRELWNTATASVLFGWQEQTLLFAGALDNKVHVLAKDSGKISVVCQCDSTVLSCASAEDGKYVFAGDDCSSIYCFDQAGERLWKLATTCGSAYSMQYYDDKVYIVTTDGVLACLDATETAIQDAKQGKVPTAKVVKADKAAVTTTADTAIESVQASAARKDGGVVVTCVPEGSKLRVRTEDDKYNATWNVQFPKNLRQAGAKFLVDELKESKNGGFYRAHGNIRRIV
mmetsp:Transcript_4735/g.13231  ORF Transcript_4735/g.13231 Transcript_4735/m.13231 type:complete len:487 (+) Transcript_4735:99-1559(+)